MCFQYRRLQERLLEDHQADHQGVREEHVDTVDQARAGAGNPAGHRSQGGGNRKPDSGQTHAQADHRARVTHVGQNQKVEVLSKALGWQHRLRQYKPGRGRYPRGVQV